MVESLVEVKAKSPKERFLKRKNAGPEGPASAHLFEVGKHLGISVARVSVQVGTRNWGFAKRDFMIGYYRCTLHFLRTFRGEVHRYSFPGVTRSALLKSSFTLFFRVHPENGNEIFIVPNSVLLERFSEGASFMRFYIPLEKSKKKVFGKGPIKWFSYLNAWHLLQMPRSNKTSANG
ncbi:MAG: hypothetical protein AAB458_01835 [Patescibacteria group bacterium]